MDGQKRYKEASVDAKHSIPAFFIRKCTSLDGANDNIIVWDAVILVDFYSSLITRVGCHNPGGLLLIFNNMFGML